MQRILHVDAPQPSPSLSIGETTSEGAEDEDCSSLMAEQIMRSLEDPHGTPETSKPDDCTLEGADDEAEPEPDPSSKEARSSPSEAG